MYGRTLFQSRDASPLLTDPQGRHYLLFVDWITPAHNAESLEALVHRNPGVLRIVYRHFPLGQDCNPLIDHAYHPLACHYAKLAACAGEQGKFWEVHDLLFERRPASQPVDARWLAAGSGLDASALQRCVESRGAQLIEPDIRDGVAVRVRVTPTFIADGSVYVGELPPDLLDDYDLGR